MRISSWLLYVVFILLTSACTATTPPTPTPPAVLPPTAPPVSAKMIRLSASEFPPYMGETLLAQGVLTEIVFESYKRMGYEVIIEFKPWARALEEAELGEYDGIYGLWHRPEREEWFLFSDPIMANEVGFYKRVGEEIPFAEMKDLEPYVVGVVRGYVNPPEFEAVTTIKRDEAVDDAMNLNKLCHNRIDLALVERGVGIFVLNSQLPECQDKLEWMGAVLTSDPLYLGISKKTAGASTKIADFNEGLKLLTADGTLQEILTKHGFINEIAQVTE